MTAVEDIAAKARELTASGKKAHEVVEAVLDLGHAAGFAAINETMTTKRLVLDFHNGELIEFDGKEWRYRRAEESMDGDAEG